MHWLGMPPQQFLDRYWQKRPLLIRGALRSVEFPLDADELAGLACETLAESRLVRGPDAADRWRLEHGPFAEDRFGELGDRDWTLLVQDVDKLDADVGELLELLHFLPRWRIDDIMVSFAAPGGSVGPHVDQYDVFLWQVAGQRRWAWDERPGEYVMRTDDCPLDMLREFDPAHTATLAPGDVLYLPPGVAHHGVAVDAGMTASLGMRAPGVDELLVDLAEHLAAQTGAADRYRDPDLTMPTDSGILDAAALTRVRELLENRLQMDDRAFGEWFAGFASRYRLAHQVAPPPTAVDAQSLRRALAAGAALVAHPYTRQVAWEDKLFVNGESFATGAQIAGALANGRPLLRADVDALGKSAFELLLQLVNAGYWLVDDDP